MFGSCVTYKQYSWRTACQCGPYEEKLIGHLLNTERYQPLARPVAHEDLPVTVVFGVSLQQIVEVVSWRWLDSPVW